VAVALAATLAGSIICETAGIAVWTLSMFVALEGAPSARLRRPG
jgi:hypothetical protein